MKIKKVTLTGADDSIRAAELLDISIKYPFVEWGILLSRNSKGNKRFPSQPWLNELSILHDGFNLSGHLCGAYVRELLMGNSSFISEIGDVWKCLSRIQINTHGEPHSYDLARLTYVLTKNLDKEFIFQYDNVNKDLFEKIAFLPNVSALFDLSHGAGVLPESWPHPLTQVPCGYAGGLSPENLLGQLVNIESAVMDGEIWIDMETKIRSNNDKQFDLDKVIKVLEICKNSKYIN